jgi:outer membrane protein OmpA-like peptidoglycan-associated protein
MKKRNVMRTLLATVAASAALLAGCGLTPSTTKDGQVAFPDAKWSPMKEGTFVNVNNVRNVQPGLTKDQVYALIAQPHFQEGIFYVHVWNYIFDFRQPDGSVLQCRYQVQFDHHMIVKATYWGNQQCADFVNQPAPVAQVAAPESPPRQMVMDDTTVTGGAKFDFDKATLKPIAKAALNRFIERTHDLPVGTVEVRGYTDSVGTVAYNLGLSRRRAASVVGYLRTHGLRAQHYDSHGYGKAHPVASNATAEGRARNRRVEITLEQPQQ